MIAFNNNTITGLYYSGYTIVRAYGCGGELVFGEEPTPPTPTDGKLKYTISGTTYVMPCDGNPLLTSLDISRDVYSRGLPLSDVSAITSVEVGSCVTTLDNNMFNAFYSLSSATCANSVVSIGYDAFSVCWNLTGFNIPSGVTVVSDYMFSDCSGMTSVTIPSGVTSIGIDAFEECLSLWNIVIPSGVTSIGDLAFQSDYYTQEPWRTKMIEMNNNRTVTILAPVPPTLGDGVFSIMDDTSDYATYPIYVPAESVNAYKSAWSVYANRIFPIE